MWEEAASVSTGDGAVQGVRRCQHLSARAGAPCVQGVEEVAREPQHRLLCEPHRAIQKHKLQSPSCMRTTWISVTAFHWLSSSSLLTKSTKLPSCRTCTHRSSELRTRTAMAQKYDGTKAAVRRTEEQSAHTAFAGWLRRCFSIHESVDAPARGTPPPPRYPAHAVLLLLGLLGRARLQGARGCHPQSNLSRLALPAMKAMKALR